MITDWCGTTRGHRGHLRRDDAICDACRVAHERALHALRSSPPDQPMHYRLALAGQEVADALTTWDRSRLVAELHRDGLTDLAIAARTRMTLYTAARIRDGLGLRPRRDWTPARSAA